MTKTEYYALEYDSQSLLKNVLKGPAGLYAYQNRTWDRNLSIITGNAVDCLLTTPGEWDNEFVDYDKKLPSPDICKLLELYYSETKSKDLDDDLLLELSQRPIFGKKNDSAYDNRTKKRESRLAKFKSVEAINYYGTISDGRSLITPDLLAIINNCVHQLINSYTEAFFKLPPQIKVEYQIPLINHKLKRKGLIDMLLHNEGDTILLGNGYVFKANSTLIIDIKTGRYGPGRLNDYISEWNIPFQLAFYKDFYQSLNPEKTLVDPIIVYAHQNAYTTYTTWRIITNEEIEQGRKEYEKALEMISMYREQGQWKIDPYIYQRKGQVI